MKGMRMSEHLQRRTHEISPGERASVFRRVWNMAHGTRASALVSAVVALLAIVDCLTKKSYLEASLGIRFLTGILSCIVAQAVYVTRRGRMGGVLQALAEVALDIETMVSPASNAELQRAARRCRLMQRLWNAYSFMIIVSVLLPTLTTGALSMPVYPRPETWPSPQLSLALTYVAQIITGTCCPIAFYTLWGYLVSAQTACASLFRACGAVIRDARGARALLRCARLHAMLSEAAIRLDRLTSDVMIFTFSAALVLPIQGTYDVTQGYVDSYAVSSFPILLVVFVPMCFGSQGLSDASERVGLRAYAGDWPAEDPVARQVRAMVMLRASKPAVITCRGLGPLGLPLCESVLKSWFSYLQMLLNLTNKTSSHRRHHHSAA